jgi:hypothetical protein
VNKRRGPYSALRRLRYPGTITANADGAHSEGHRQLAERLAIDLDPHEAGCGNYGAARSQVGDPGQAEVRAAPAGPEMPDEPMPGRPGEETQVQAVAVEARARSDPQAAAIGEHREGGGMPLAIDVHDKRPERHRQAARLEDSLHRAHDGRRGLTRAKLGIEQLLGRVVEDADEDLLLGRTRGQPRITAAVEVQELAGA